MFGTVDVEAVAAVLADRLSGRRPRVLVSAGPGLEGLADAVGSPVVVPGIDVGLPGGASSGAPALVLAGTLGGADVLVHVGGVALHQGIDVGAVVAAVDVAALLGVDTLVATAVAEPVGDRGRPGDVLAVTDHLNLTGQSPLVGRSRPDHVDLDAAYDAGLRRHAGAAAGCGRRARRILDGVYAGVVGPERPTAAERRMLAALGADAVGHGLVMEVLAARAAGMRVLGLCLLGSLVGGAPDAGAGPRAGGRAVHSGVAVLADIVGDVLGTLQ